ncbi:transcription initiation factor TFIID subunit 3 [Scaptodrosophila lebanonensis]|uniref:Transcription initiation factor TFIID subunit 3 n=1 Tax=Drosophila lebanonensis TaxID=7225 RepID=A0A6J2TTA8_DROLE|nr:transcription initiation factor TFIID subunit 3 [Scaptodrosophila lebanonensis]
MTDKYCADLLRIAVAQISQTIGYSSAQTAPLELLQDVLHKFLQEFARDLHSQTEHANRIEPNLKDTHLSLKSLNINIPDLLDYIGNVEPVQFAQEIPQFPVKRNSNMNFLKPGSSETLTRPVHIYEHLPPMLPTEPTSSGHSSAGCSGNQLEQGDMVPASALEAGGEVTLPNGSKSISSPSPFPSSQLFPSQEPNADIPSTNATPWSNSVDAGMPLHPSARNLDVEGGATREISSVVMTTGGYISPAIEGKLPSAFVPDIIDKFKGLDVPPPSPPPPPLQTINSIGNDTPIDSTISKDVISMQPMPTETHGVPTEGATNVDKKEPTVTPIAEVKPMVADIKLKKKNKKRPLPRIPWPLEQSANNKALEKAQKKALKKALKLSKSKDTMDPSGNPQKPKAAFREIPQLQKLSTLGDKQAKQRLKQLRKEHLQQVRKKQMHQEKEMIKQLKGQNLQMQQQPTLSTPLPFYGHLPGIMHHISSEDIAANKPPIVFGNTDNTMQPMATQIPKTQVESKDMVAAALAREACQTDEGAMPPEIKLPSEPDRNKLNIFKKLSKAKVKAALSPTLPMGLSTNIFGNNFNGTPLINLPSGTTITPAPALPIPNVGGFVSVTPNSIPHLRQPNMMATDLSKPKKRGRKPGSRNQAKLLTTDALGSPMQPAKKVRYNKMNAIPFEQGVIQMNEAQLIPELTPMEPLNLSNIDEFQVGEPAQFLPSNPPLAPVPNQETLKPKTKEKKERKKYKSKYNPLGLKTDESFPMEAIPADAVNKKMPPVVNHVTDNITLIPPSKAANSAKSPGNTKKRNPNILSPIVSRDHNIGISDTLIPMQPIPLLPMPLLSFPPRPGLIPSGPGLFPTPGLNSFGPNMLLPQFMASPGSANNVSRTNIEPPETKLPNLMKAPLPESQPERSFCNVAPLIPGYMKRIIGDNQIVSTPMSEFDSSASISGSSQSNTLRFFEETKPKAMLSTPSGTGNLGDPIEVSDDSDESNAVKKQPPPKPSPTNFSFAHTHNTKSNLIQPPNLPYGPPQVADVHHTLTPLPSPIPEAKKIKKQAKQTTSLKLNQQEASIPSSSNTPFDLNFMGGSDKFCLAGGADLIPLSREDSGLAYSSRTVPATSLAAGATSGSITLPTSTQVTNISVDQSGMMPNYERSGNYDDVTITPTNVMSLDLMKSRNKEHKKLKKPKEGKDGKIKKKKDKKDKSKNKERSEEKHLHKSDKIKALDKKPKKDKKKIKQGVGDAMVMMKPQEPPIGALEAIPLFEPISVEPPSFVGPEPLATGHISPKMELSPNQVPKLTLKLDRKSTPLPIEEPQETSSHATAVPSKRDQSPELARFSPLVTGPPKPKQSETNQQPLGLSLATAASLCTGVSSTIPINPSTQTMPASSVLLPHQLLPPPKPMPSGALGSAAGPPGSSTSMAVSPPKIDGTPQVLQTQIAKSNRPSSYVDAEGNRIWICPACGKVDDGSAMIGCDGCDAWYHWVCVGIFVEPKDNEDWFCRVCITRKRVHGSDKKRKRNKKK